jgi:hypothetical protein
LVATQRTVPGVVVCGSLRVRAEAIATELPSGSPMIATSSTRVSAGSQSTLPAQRLLVMRVRFTPRRQPDSPCRRHSTWATASPSASPVNGRRTPMELRVG